MWSPPRYAPVLRYAGEVLQRLGYHVRVHVLKLADYYPYINDTRHHAQVGFFNWIAEVPSASSFFDTFSCAHLILGSEANWNPSRFCDRGLDAGVAAALAAKGTDANARWAASIAGCWTRPRRFRCSTAGWCYWSPTGSATPNCIRSSGRCWINFGSVSRILPHLNRLQPAANRSSASSVAFSQLPPGASPMRSTLITTAVTVTLLGVGAAPAMARADLCAECRSTPPTTRQRCACSPSKHQRDADVGYTRRRRPRASSACRWRATASTGSMAPSAPVLTAALLLGAAGIGIAPAATRP